MTNLQGRLVLVAIILCSWHRFLPTVTAFQQSTPNQHHNYCRYRPLWRINPHSNSACRPFVSGSMSTTTTRLYEKKPEYSRELYLREEAESPFRKVRFFLYFSLGGGALTSLAVSLARVAAALNGINENLLSESALNVAVDVAGLVILTWAYRNDLASQESRLKRASKGAELAKLNIRASKNIVTGDFSSLDKRAKRETFVTTLASLRRGRGIEKRVVIAVAGPERIVQVLKESRELQEDLTFNDLLVIPYLLGGSSSIEDLLLSSSDDVDDDTDADTFLPDCVALPTSSANWKTFIEAEVAEATQQGVDAMTEGVTVILKKNGRIGQRTRGIYLSNMVADVTGRSSMGMDITNI